MRTAVVLLIAMLLPWSSVGANADYDDANLHVFLDHELTFVEIFDLTGRRVRSLVDGPVDAGLHEMVWNGEDDHGRVLASGSYVYRLEAAGYREIQRMTMVK